MNSVNVENAKMQERARIRHSVISDIPKVQIEGGGEMVRLKDVLAILSGTIKQTQ